MAGMSFLSCTIPPFPLGQKRHCIFSESHPGRGRGGLFIHGMLHGITEHRRELEEGMDEEGGMECYEVAETSSFFFWHSEEPGIGGGVRESLSWQTNGV